VCLPADDNGCDIFEVYGAGGVLTPANKMVTVTVTVMVMVMMMMVMIMVRNGNYNGDVEVMVTLTVMVVMRVIATFMGMVMMKAVNSSQQAADSRQQTAGS
jgi:heme/copper-type cytochrome/quinol oxidase subunit 2